MEERENGTTRFVAILLPYLLARNSSACPGYLLFPSFLGGLVLQGVEGQKPVYLPVLSW